MLLAYAYIPKKLSSFLLVSRTDPSTLHAMLQSVVGLLLLLLLLIIGIALCLSFL